MRVHELAKERQTTSKELLARLQELGIDVKNRLSSVGDNVLELLREDDEETEVAPIRTAKIEKAPAKRLLKKDGEEEREPVLPPPPRKTPPAAKAPVPILPPAPVAPPSAASEAPAPEPAARQESAPPNPVVKVSGPLTVQQLAAKLGLRPNRLVAELMRLNVLASINERVEVDIARKIAIKHGFMLEVEKKIEPPKPVVRPIEVRDDEEDRPEDLQPRPPVVTFLGHVDHGKTSLLDRIRKTMVTAGEAGGITQHIGAYTIDESGRQVTFLDTPGHAAFTAMRARGANLTDIAVIIVAADDGVMPQTKEAIMHAKAADVCMMAAINKIDMPGANVERVKQQFLAEGLTPEDWGGTLVCVPVSAITGEGVEQLVEMLLLQAEVLDLKANPKRRARGYVIESQLEQGMGPTANLLIKNGTLKVGDTILCGAHWGRVRALINDHGVKVKTAGPATPIKCLGLSGVPEAGAEFRVVTDDKDARAAAATEQTRLKDGQLQTQRKTTLTDLFERIEANQRIELKVIVKADTQGSVEAISHALREIKSDKVSLNIVMAATGSITANDVMLASASNAVILGFHIGKESGVPNLAKHHGVEIRLHQIIYELLDVVKEAMTGLLAPRMEERDRGKALVKQVFDLGKQGCVAGSLVTSGHVRPSYRVRVRRSGDVLYEGSIVSLRHFQTDAAEVRESQECGVRLDNYRDFAPGDMLEFYEIEAVRQSL